MFRSCFHGKKKPAQNISVAGFTIRSLTPVVTTWGNQFIASTNLKAHSVSAECVPPFRRTCRWSWQKNLRQIASADAAQGFRGSQSRFGMACRNWQTQASRHV